MIIFGATGLLSAISRFSSSPQKVGLVLDRITTGLGSKAVAQAFAPLLSARLHEIYDCTVGESLPTHWFPLIGAAIGSSSADPEAARDGLAEAGPKPPASMRILVVEDDGLIRMITARLLKEFGHLVHEAADGDEALALLSEWPIDLLITDVNLPGMSGLELARRAVLRAPALRIIFATGMKASVLGPSLPPRALVMAKPYGEWELRSALAEVIRL